ncbi:potassium-transporting ATPase subunit KdpC [Leucobacter insecticola]|uniref:Potassium-transporting ATPase KdpC subunit n=1 Tax=Leucobacter insecticola TaxID=2714934 RepID=A0A6G8FJT5_9MICO|nr:potassium-transporting ATPase subunit KdpC [Leucobacter insecticola]QIM16730.1 potassium-transporting ATPase subunit KdpC [Leucobacter insecticola]
MPKKLARRVTPLWTGLRIALLLTVVLGIAYPLLVTGIGQLVFPSQANGSLLRGPDGEIAGSALLGQRFEASDGSPLPEYFQPRPSVAGDGYDSTASGGSNLGPESPELIAEVSARRDAIAEFNGVDPSEVPADAVTASGSGLDPHISVDYAYLQAARVAEARGVPLGTVTALLDAYTTGRDAGFMGERRVNVVELNLALDALR